MARFTRRRFYIGNTFVKALMISLGVIIGYWLLTTMTGLEYFTTGYMVYVPSLILGGIGLWMIFNRIDEDTHFGFGILSIAGLYTAMIFGLL